VGARDDENVRKRGGPHPPQASAPPQRAICHSTRSATPRRARHERNRSGRARKSPALRGFSFSAPERLERPTGRTFRLDSSRPLAGPSADEAWPPPARPTRILVEDARLERGTA